MQQAKVGRAACACCWMREPAHQPLTATTDMTALHCAAWHGHEACLRVLVEYGAPMGALDMWGRTPADLAAVQKHATCLRALQELGCRRAAALYARQRQGVLHLVGALALLMQL